MQNTGFQSALATLLACENLVVTYNAKATTASFNVQTRQLELPVLEGQDDELEYGLLTHEVAHALYSDMDELSDMSRKYGHSKVNIAEDLRIERLMKAKYPGVARKLPRAWTSFLPRIFPDGMQITENFWTRVNAELKTDLHYTVPFSCDERAAVRAISAVVNSDGSLEEIIQIIDSFAKEENDENAEREAQEPTQPEETDEPADGEETEETGDSEESEETDETQETKESGGDGDADEGNDAAAEEPGESDDDEDAEPNEDDDEDAEPDEEEIKNPSFDEAPKVGNTVEIKAIGDAALNIDNGDDQLVVDLLNLRSDDDLVSKPKYKKFLKTYDNLAQNMLQQFYMKKQAYNYALMSEQDTGDLDSDLFSEYLTREDLFHSEQIEPNQEHHAFFTLIDFSASMTDDIKKILGNELIVAMFCRQADIPHRGVLYASHRRNHNYILFDSQMSEEDFNLSVEFCYHIIQDTRRGRHFFQSLSGGTPLRPSILNVSYYIQDWVDAGRKVTVLALTDGSCTANMGNPAYFTRPDVPARYFEYNIGGCFEYLKHKHGNLSVCFLYVGNTWFEGLRRDRWEPVNHRDVSDVKETAVKTGNLTQINLKIAQRAPRLNFDGFDSLFILNTYRYGCQDNPTAEISRTLGTLDQKVAATYNKIIEKQNANKEMEFFVEQFLNDVA